jgi:hypothetical protein
MPSKSDGAWQVRPEFGDRRYRKIDTRLWNDARVRRFSVTGKLVWAFLLSAPTTTSIPGLFPLTEHGAASALGITLEGFREGFREPMREGLVEADWEAGVVWLRKAARYEWPTGPNVIKSWRKVVRSDLPECPLVLRALHQIREELQWVYGTPEPFITAFRDAFPEPFWDGYPEPIPAQDAGCRMQDAGELPASQVSAAPEAPPVQRTLVAVEAAPAPAEKPKRPPTAVAQWAQEANEKRKAVIAPDAPQEAELRKHQWPVLGAALKAHGALTLNSALALFLAAEGYPRENSYPLGLFVSQLAMWVTKAQASALLGRTGSSGDRPRLPPREAAPLSVVPNPDRPRL